jgi:hypothetical protein
MLIIGIILFGIAVYNWFLVESLAWEDIKSIAGFSVCSICLLIVFGNEYLKKRKSEQEID